MKLSYKILWFEDDQDYFEEDLQPDAKNFIESKGFNFVCVYRKNGSELKDLIEHQTYDLIVSDLNLGKDETGEKLIDYIRDEKHILTEVLLYSANESALTTIIENKGWIERASFSIGLRNLPGKLKNIINLSIKKVEDVNNLRGLVIAETIDLEKKIEFVLLKFFEASEAKVSNEIKEKLRKSIYEKKLSKHQKDLESIEKIPLIDIKNLIDEDVLTANNTYETVASIIKNKLVMINVQLSIKGLESEFKVKLLQEKERFETIRSEYINFKKEIIDIRNILAHVEEKKDENGVPYLKSSMKGMEEIRFNSEKYIEIRTHLKKHSNNLDSILENIID